MSATQKATVVAEPAPKTTHKPLGRKSASKLSISAALKNSAATVQEETKEEHKSLPAQHFTETDLQEIWNKWLHDLQENDFITFSAIQSFHLKKTGESSIEVQYPSETAKTEFDRIKTDFLNHFMHRVNNFSVTLDYRQNISLKQEILTKRNIFNKFAELNPLLRELNSKFEFDLSG